MTLLHWPLEMPQDPETEYVGGLNNNRETFQPRAGEPIERRLKTSSLEVYQITVKPIKIPIFEQFEDWFRDEIDDGVQWFNMRHPVNKNVRQARILAGEPPYRVSSVSGGYSVALQMQIMYRRQSPWYADYVPSGVSRPPLFVADYENGVYGINGALVPSSQLPTISGTYVVERTASGQVKAAVETLSAGSIPENPAVSTQILGFAV